MNEEETEVLQNTDDIVVELDDEEKLVLFTTAVVEELARTLELVYE